jgi:hypothetical protein
LPEKGGFDPSVGIDLKYFTDKSGFSRPMIAMEEPGVKWLSGIMTVRMRMGKRSWWRDMIGARDWGSDMSRGLWFTTMRRKIFEKAMALKKNEPLYPDGVPVKVSVGEEDFIIFLRRIRFRWYG